MSALPAPEREALAGLGGRPLALLLATARGLGLVWSDRQRHRPDAVAAEPDLLDELLG